MVKKLLIAWDNFWFGPQDLLGLACMRIVLCGTLMYMALARFSALWFYTDESWIPRRLALEIMPEVARPVFMWTFWPDAWNFAANLTLVTVLGLLVLGIGGRYLMWFAWILNAGFLQRNYAVNFGADIIGALFLFYMSFTQSCERLSLWNLVRNKVNYFRQSDILSSVFIRMMQFQICVIYAYTGFEKLKGGAWWDGTALWTVLANPQMTSFDFSFMRHFPWVIPVVGYLTILFEIYFPALVAWSKTRSLALIFGVLFHLGIGVTMGLMPFATVMISTYFLFMNPAFLARMGRFIMRKSA